MERGRSRGPQARTVEALADALLLRGESRVAFTTAAGRGRSRPVGAARGELPGVDALFVGRVDERRRLAEAMAGGGGARPVVVSGPGGIGKTTLVVRAARDVIDRFEGGHDFVALRGQSGDPVAPAAVAASLLVAHGTSEQDLPRTAEELFAALATSLGARHGLLVLDDAHDEAQVRPLLVTVAGRSSSSPADAPSAVSTPPTGSA